MASPSLLRRGVSALLPVWAALVLVGLAGCVFEPTEVLVRRDTDAPTSRPMVVTVRVQGGDVHSAGTVRTWIYGDAGATYSMDGGSTRLDGGSALGTDGGDAQGSFAGAITFPASFGIVPGPGQPHDGPVLLTVTAVLLPRSASEPMRTFVRTARFRFVPGRASAFPLFLAIRCGDASSGCTSVPPDRCTQSVLCEETNRTCGDRGVCVDPTVATQSIGAHDGNIDVGNCLAPCAGAPHATGRCVAGSCLLTCDEGWGNCDASDTNGCESTTTSSPDQCGGCGVRCMTPNATPVCSGGACGIARCTPGFGDADGLASTGCECVTDTNASSCAGITAPISLATGGSRTVTGMVLPTGSEDWFHVAFAAGGHPRIGFVTNPGGHVLGVYSSCGSRTQSCPDRAGGASGLTSWEFFDDTMGTPRSIPEPGTVYLRVTSASPAVCTSYSIALSN
ncbi:MAG: hypothetical protein WCJ30_16915 [Deltaproteobacteria bacterium]